MSTKLRSKPLTLAACIAGCFALTVAAPVCHAAYPNVTNCNDSGPGSLRATIAAAGEGDSVVLNPTNLHCSVITVSSAEIPVPQQNLTIKYNADNQNRFTISASGHHRIFKHSGSGKLELDRLSLQFGEATDADAIPVVTGKYYTKIVLGGCVYSSGVVDLESSQVKYCSITGSPGFGGGIAAANGLIVNRSTLRNNTAISGQAYSSCGAAIAGKVGLDRTGGYINANYSVVRNNTVTGSGGGLCIAGLFDAAGPPSLIQNSTISGNQAAYASALSTSGLTTIANSTVSGNVSTESDYGPGPIFAGKSLTLLNSTIASNPSVNGAAIWFNNQKYDSNAHYGVHFESSIIADNTSNGVESDVYSRVQPDQVLNITGLNNVIMAWSDGVAVPGDTIARNPLLLPLADNGGPTLTQAFADGSPAMGAGNNAVGQFANDQRGSGYPRGAGGAVDIGAYQRQQGRDVVFASGFD